MPKDSITFIWHGKDYRGKSAHGRSRTRDEDSLRTSLRQQGIKLIHAETAPPCTPAVNEHRHPEIFIN